MIVLQQMNDCLLKTVMLYGCWCELREHPAIKDHCSSAGAWRPDDVTFSDGSHWRPGRHASFGFLAWFGFGGVCCLRVRFRQECKAKNSFIG